MLVVSCGQIPRSRHYGNAPVQGGINIESVTSSGVLFTEFFLIFGREMKAEKNKKRYAHTCILSCQVLIGFAVRKFYPVQSEKS